MNNLIISTVAQLALGIGVPLLLFWIGSHMKDANTRAAFNAAAARAGGLAYEAMVRPGAGVESLAAARTSALNQAVDYLRATMPDTLHNLGLTDESKLRQLVSGELGKLLAVGPNVGIGDQAVVAPDSAALTAAVQLR